MAACVSLLRDEPSEPSSIRRLELEGSRPSALTSIENANDKSLEEADSNGNSLESAPPVASRAITLLQTNPIVKPVQQVHMLLLESRANLITIS